MLGNPVWIGNPLGHLGLAAIRMGNLDEGRAYLGEAIATIRQSGYKRGLAWDAATSGGSGGGQR